LYIGIAGVIAFTLYYYWCQCRRRHRHREAEWHAADEGAEVAVVEVELEEVIKQVVYKQNWGRGAPQKKN